MHILCLGLLRVQFYNNRAPFWGTLKLQDWTSQDWTLTDDFAGVDIAGLDNDGRMCGQLTELKLQNFIP